MPSLPAISPSRRALVVLAVTVVSLAARGGPILLLPGPPPDSATRLQDSTWSRSAANYLLSVTWIDDAGRLAWIEQATGHAIDPFAAPPGAEPRYVSFLVTVENRGDNAFLFDMQSCRLVGAHSVATPLGLEELQANYASLGQPFPPAYLSVRAAMVEGARHLAPGERLTALAVYRASDARSRRFHLEPQIVLPDGEIARLHAPYQRVSAKRAGRGVKP